MFIDDGVGVVRVLVVGECASNALLPALPSACGRTPAKLDAVNG
ncbi:MAG TPA: hypothetical protein VFL10_16980 [Ornithinibacter sp.]|nr:hypothetical protein [Ornithinibacter sp.]